MGKHIGDHLSDTEMKLNQVFVSQAKQDCHHRHPSSQPLKLLKGGNLFSFCNQSKVWTAFWMWEVLRTSLCHQRSTLIPVPSLPNTELFGSQIQAPVYKKPFQVIFKCFINSRISRLKEVSMLWLR